MKKLIIIFLCNIFFLSYSENTIEYTSVQDVAEDVSSAISYELNGGRFGDNLLSYCRAKWLSYIYDIPLVLLPFPYADQLKLYELEPLLCIDNFKNIIRLSSSGHYQLKKYNNTLYINHWRTKVEINWNDSAFITQLKELIAPRYNIQKISIPDGYISVAIHVRTGGSFAADTVQEQERCPLRFVSHEFFIAQIQRIAQMFEGQRLYVYIFTDHKKPKQIAKEFNEALNNENIIIDYNKEANSHKINVLEDFFSMMQFQCLIRPGSHFSRFVERLGDAQLVIFPYSVRKKSKESSIDVIAIKKRLANGKWKTEKVKIN